VGRGSEDIFKIENNFGDAQVRLQNTAFELSIKQRKISDDVCSVEKRKK